MGYTHYYQVQAQFDKDQFAKVAADFKKMVEPLQHLGVKLAGGNGEGQPEINDNEIWFNGVSKCGHQERDLGITWPSKSANGVSENKVLTSLGELTKGHWFAGAELESRACGGHCDHETFGLSVKTDYKSYYTDEQNKENGMYIFEFCKTAYKPYDLAVNVVLIIAKHYLGNDILVSSDGDQSNWIEGAQLVQHFLGYGGDFDINKCSADNDKIIEAAKKKATQEEIKEILNVDNEKIKKLENEIKTMSDRLDFWLNEKGKADAHAKIYANKIASARKLIEAEQNKPDDEVKVGDIFVRSWGYDQTNVNFVKIVRVTKSGKSAYMKPIGQKQVESHSSMSESVIPQPEHELDKKEFIGRIRRYDSGSYLYCGDYHKWDGKPCFSSSWA